MKHLKMLAVTVAAAAAMLSLPAAASATQITCESGGSFLVCSAGTSVRHELKEGVVKLEPPIGTIECRKSTIETTTSNTGSAAETVLATVPVYALAECNATVTVLKSGTLEYHTDNPKVADGNATVTSNELEATVELAGFHCIFTTANTDIGTIKGSDSEPPVMITNAEVPRTSGRSGAFCGSTAHWSGTYKISAHTTID